MDPSVQYIENIGSSSMYLLHARIRIISDRIRVTAKLASISFL